MFLLKKNHPKNVMPPSRRRFHRDNTEEQDELNRVDNDDHAIPMENDDINNTVNSWRNQSQGKIQKEVCWLVQLSFPCSTRWPA